MVAELVRPARPAEPDASPRARAWLAGTVILTLGAAGAAIALAPPAGAPAPEGLAFLLFIGSSVHVASTGWFYTVPEVRAHMRRHRARYIWWPIALIAGACTIAATMPRAALYWLLLPYFGWQFFHYQKQNLGLAALCAAAKRLAPLSSAERRALIGAGLAGIAGLAGRPGLLQLPIRPPVPALTPVAAIAFAVCVAAGTGCLLARPRSQRPVALCTVYLTALTFSLPVFLFSSPYAAVAGLTVAHGLQYLLLMALLAAASEAGRKPARKPPPELATGAPASSRWRHWPILPCSAAPRCQSLPISSPRDLPCDGCTGCSSAS